MIAPKKNGSLSIDLVIAALLADLETPAAAGGLKPEDVESTRAGLVAAIDNQQLLTFIRELAGAGRISPKAPSGNRSSEVGGDWTLTTAHRKLLRNALSERIDEAVQKVEARRRAVADQDRRLAEEKLTVGRYTLAEAAAAPGEDKKRLLKSLLRDASAMKLPVYYPGEKQRVAQEQMPARDYFELYWDDFNAWLITNERRIEFRFLAPGSQLMQTPAVLPVPAALDEATPTPIAKQRRSVLDQVIDAAVEKAGSRETATVWIQLKELALSSTPPFSGEVSDRALGYTNARNRAATFTKKSLGQRLRRAQEDR